MQTLIHWAGENVAAHARDARLPQAAIAEGVADRDGGGWLVRAQTTPDMTVRVGSGVAGDVAYVQGDANSLQGIYTVQNSDSFVGDANSDVPIAPADATNPRHDLIVLRVFDDAEDSSTQNTALVDVVTGTPAATPADPAVPDTTLVLARVVVPAGATSITNSDIVDLRVQATIRSAFTSGEQLLATAVGDGTGTLIVANNIPQGFNHLRVVGTLRHDGGASLINANLRFNAIATGNLYNGVREDVDGAGQTIGHINGANGWLFAVGDRAGSIDILIPNYVSATLMGVRLNAGAAIGSAATSMVAIELTGWLNSNGPVTEVRFVISGANFTSESVVSLYGLP